MFFLAIRTKLEIYRSWPFLQFMLLAAIYIQHFVPHQLSPILFVFTVLLSAKQFRDLLARKHGIDSGLAMIIKQRAKANEIDRMDLVGNVQGSDCILGG